MTKALKQGGTEHYIFTNCKWISLSKTSKH